MASRMLSPAIRAFASPSTAFRSSSTAAMGSRLLSPAARSFQTSSRRFAEVAVPLPVRKPVGAFRGGLFGFLLGSTLAGAGTYYYILDEYRLSNELLTEDIYSLQASVQRVHTYVQTLEEKIDELNKKKK